eukprot:TRINITY_DN8916_c0_g1_i1.p1 TRINITY_DN8916_c0_g1~~TRINITY_DN8916_c0_g1_i1.p1  ORF type:complete len:268 (+),score=42.23 TRINITY_DN8916_c0_g1_i1:72-806(+)
MSILDTPCCVLLGTGTAPGTRLSALLGAKEFALLDFWTTRCTRCPSALNKLDAAAAAGATPNVAFISVNLDDFEAARALTAGKWTNMLHVAVDEGAREVLKERLGMQAVPFYVLVSRGGLILASGAPKDVPVEHLRELLNGNCENIPSPPSPSTTGKAALGDAMQCVGGVCPLPRRKKAPLSPPAASECVNGVCPLPRRTPKTRSPLAPRNALAPVSQAAPVAPKPSSMQMSAPVYAFSMDEDF